jgi:hypothetical protein
VADIAFGAVWRPGGGAQWVRWGMTGDQFKAQDATYFPQGLRISALELEGGTIAAVWRPGSGTQWMRWGMTSEEFKARDRSYFPQGLRITSLVVENGRYAAVWRRPTRRKGGSRCRSLSARSASRRREVQT